MDNAIEALKMAFAVFVFVIALTISMSALSQAKIVSDEVFYMADKTNFYEYTSDDEEKIKENSEGRIVSMETIIPTLYRYYKENFKVTIKLNKPGYEDVVFDLEQEIQKYATNYALAPWLGNANIDTKERVDVEIDGKMRKINTTDYYPVIKGGLLEYAKHGDGGGEVKFRETFREYRYSGREITIDENGEIVYVKNEHDVDDEVTKYVTTTDQETLELVKGNTKIEITYEAIYDNI